MGDGLLWAGLAVILAGLERGQLMLPAGVSNYSWDIFGSRLVENVIGSR